VVPWPCCWMAEAPRCLLLMLMHVCWRNAWDLYLPAPVVDTVVHILAAVCSACTCRALVHMLLLGEWLEWRASCEVLGVA
jgi:hypothetical protein